MLFNFGGGKTAKRREKKKRADRAKKVEQWVRDSFKAIADEEGYEEKNRPALDVISVTEMRCLQKVRVVNCRRTSQFDLLRVWRETALVVGSVAASVSRQVLECRSWCPAGTMCHNNLRQKYRHATMISFHRIDSCHNKSSIPHATSFSSIRAAPLWNQ